MFVSRIFLIISITGSCYCSASRLKRVINGWEIVGRGGPYDVIKYTVGIGDVHESHWYLLGKYFESLKDNGVYGTITCGGVLLTPVVIQTACKCVASFESTGSKSARKTVIQNHWENERVVYVGLNARFGDGDTMMNRNPILSQQFFVNPSCTRLVRPDNRKNHFISYDFGYIKIKSDWTLGKSGVPTELVSFAPLYSTADLKTMYKGFQGTQPVCLTVGYGDTDERGTDSNYIRGGWVLLMTTQECLIWTCTNRYGSVNLTYDEIRLYKSWVCGQNFLNYDAHPSKGDAGSPFTCNNMFFGLVSTSSKISLKKGFFGWRKVFHRRIIQYSDIYQSQFENSADYRPAFDKAMTAFRISEITYHDVIKQMLKKYGEEFVEAAARDAADTVVEELKELFLGERAKSGNDSDLKSQSNPLKFTSSSTVRLANQETATRSFSRELHVPSVLLIFYPITMPMR